MRILETERLALEEASIRDSAFFFELLNSPSWLQYIGDRGIRDLKNAEFYIENSLIKSYRSHGFGLYKIVLKNGGLPIGICGLLKRPFLKYADLGFAILPQYEGQGYTYEAARAMMEYAGASFGLHTLYAITTEGNLKTRRLLEKLGMKLQNKIRPNRQDPEYLLYSS